MKKTIAIMLGLIVAQTASYATTNQVLSRNAVGYIRRSVENGQLDFVGAPFVNLAGGENVLSNLFPNPAAGTSAFKWDKVGQVYQFFGAKGAAWNAASATAVVSRGEGIFLKCPGSVTQTFYVMGEVPDRLTAPTTTVGIAAGLTFVSLSYPVAIAWTSTTLAAALPTGSQLVLWNKTNSQYMFYGKKGTSWQSGTNVVLQPGDAFYVKQPGGSLPFNWVEGKPYTWP
jgi:hypothetical protein